jgi:hypothetical protein
MRSKFHVECHPLNEIKRMLAGKTPSLAVVHRRTNIKCLHIELSNKAQNRTKVALQNGCFVSSSDTISYSFEFYFRHNWFTIRSRCTVVALGRGKIRFNLALAEDGLDEDGVSVVEGEIAFDRIGFLVTGYMIRGVEHVQPHPRMYFQSGHLFSDQEFCSSLRYY